MVRCASGQGKGHGARTKSMRDRPALHGGFVSQEDRARTMGHKEITALYPMGYTLGFYT